MTTATETKTRVSFLLTVGGHVVTEMSDVHLELLREALADDGMRWIVIPPGTWINRDHIVRIDAREI